MPERVVHVVIAGLVQGVGFRRSLCQEAAHLGLTGWVRNRADGTVEALAWGDARAVARLLEWSRTGPPAARVPSLQVSQGQPEAGVATGRFEQRPTV